MIAGVLFALVTVRHYGESWDELKFYKYADDALRAYLTWPQTGTIPETGNTYDNYGPAYVMFVGLGARLLGQALPWLTSDLRHVLYFVTFLVGCLAFYELCKRWLSPAGAWSAALLFGSQPLFWGHAFISPKDIPFLTFFVLSVFFGLKMVDSFEPPSLENLQTNSRRGLLVFAILWLLFLIVFFGGTSIWHRWLESSVNAAAAGENNFIARIASDVRTADPQIYIQRYFVFFLWARAILFWLSTAALAGFYRQWLPTAYRLLLSVAPAAIFLGLTTCIRVLGPLAALLVTIYAFHRHGKQSVILPQVTFGIAVRMAVMSILAGN